MFIKLLKLLAKIVLGLFIVFLAYSGYGYYAEPRAHRSAQEFCREVRLGDQPSEVLVKAQRAGASEHFLKWLKYGPDEQVLYVTFIGLPPFSRHMCKVVAGKTVKTAAYLYLD
jgi:hypothetical protein